MGKKNNPVDIDSNFLAIKTNKKVFRGFVKKLDTKGWVEKEKW